MTLLNNTIGIAKITDTFKPTTLTITSKFTAPTVDKSTNSTEAATTQYVSNYLGSISLSAAITLLDSIIG